MQVTSIIIITNDSVVFFLHAMEDEKHIFSKCYLYTTAITAVLARKVPQLLLTRLKASSFRKNAVVQNTTVNAIIVSR